MVNLFERLFGRSNQNEKSGKIAKDRLQFVLVQDRIYMPAEKMQQMQQEIIEVISKYVSVDLDNVDFDLKNRERDGVLVAEIPFRPVQMEDEAEIADEQSPIKISVEEPDDENGSREEEKDEENKEIVPSSTTATDETTAVSDDGETVDKDEEEDQENK